VSPPSEASRPDAPVIAIAATDGGGQTWRAVLAPFVRGAFGAELVEAPEIHLTSAAWSRPRRQYRASALLDALAAMKRPEWERLLGIVEVDLYAPGLNFVFGEADPRRGVAVFSLARLRHGADAALLRRRAATEAIHELGHTYGLSHCDDPACVMWFSNTLAESDRKGTAFCATHAAALRAAREDSHACSLPGASRPGS
jgi:archaemetzincin